MNADELNPNPDQGPRLSETDLAALDATFGEDVAADPAALSRLGRLLELLESPLAGRERRVAAVLAAIRTERDSALSLTADDGEALDAWVLASFDVGRVPASLRDRARAHERLASLATASAAESDSTARAGLIEATLALVESADESEEDRFRFRDVPVRNRWADLLSVAAVMLIGVSLLWPVMSTVRDRAQRAVCGSNMRTVATALGGYTADHDQIMPIATAGFGGGTWWNVGSKPERSNSANLYTLARSQYAPLESMACPGNPKALLEADSPEARDWPSFECVSYSYRVMPRPERDLWGSPDAVVIVSDRSPVIIRAVGGRTIFPFESSPNHAHQGQHMLTADGAVQWSDSPVLKSGDNIWLPKPVEVLIDVVSRRAGLKPLKGTEAPADRSDSFVGP